MRSNSSCFSGLCIAILGTILLVNTVSPVCGAVFSINGSEIEPAAVSDVLMSDPSLLQGDLLPGQVILFWNTHCGACHMAWEFLDEYLPLHPEITLIDYDLYNSTENRTIFDEYKTKYNRDHLSVPSVIVGNITIEGSQDIRTFLPEIIQLQQKNSPSNGIMSVIHNFFQKISFW
ncbi:MAG TPA: hypothetical protein PK024_04830 [Methanospirillum sp.]|uniref:glutaredoxin family protein n=1 Tax=Methanospirillum sp. TaxID=45200 RepID=UPI002CB2553F|nr:hypothetical protein [Methanospirillum sp.]HOJ96149.1 hypothetical protein [Methanospirillum sp.]HPP76625.1 hypothetical protein [Methanospirillum sp.]